MRSLLLSFALLPLQTSAENSLSQTLINRIRSSSLPSWKSLADLLETAFDDAGDAARGGEERYDDARRRALRWLSTDPYALSLLDDAAEERSSKLLQRYALATIYHSAAPSERSRCGPGDEACAEEMRFLSPGDHLDWEGINGKNGLVTWLDLSSRNLSNCPSSSTEGAEVPALPLEATLLSPSLELMWLHSNPLCGTLPEYVGEFAGLQSLSLHSTNMSGTLPRSLWELDSLTSLRLYKSNFAGSLGEAGRLKNLKWMWIHENGFTGELPKMGNLTALEGITLHGNDFSDADNGEKEAGLCELAEKGNLKYLWVDCREGSVVEKGGEWRVVEGVGACECCTRCFPREGGAVAIS